jgi:protein PsiE
MNNSTPMKSIKKAIRHVEMIGLVFIALATIFAFGHEMLYVILSFKVTLGDLLLLFLYLEILAMVAIYMDSGKLPVRLPLYIAIIALARYLILDMKNLSEYQMLAISGTMVLIALTVIIIRYGHVKLPYKEHSLLEKNLPEKKTELL